MALPHIHNAFKIRPHKEGAIGGYVGALFIWPLLRRMRHILVGISGALLVIQTSYNMCSSPWARTHLGRELFLGNKGPRLRTEDARLHVAWPVHLIPAGIQERRTDWVRYIE
jgi:hypothetical protein